MSLKTCLIEQIKAQFIFLMKRESVIINDYLFFGTMAFLPNCSNLPYDQQTCSSKPAEIIKIAGW